MMGWFDGDGHFVEPWFGGGGLTTARARAILTDGLLFQPEADPSEIVSLVRIYALDGETILAAGHVTADGRIVMDGPG